MTAAAVISEIAPPPQPSFLFGRSLLWLLLVLPASGAFAWVAAQLSHFWAPWLIFPIGVGLLWGWVSGCLARALQLKHRPTIVSGAILAGLTVAIAMHGHEYRADLHAPRSAQLDTLVNVFPDMAERPNVTASHGFWDFLSRQATLGRKMPFGFTAHGVWAWISWTLDAALLTTGIGLMSLATTHRPFCGRCATFLRQARQERVSAATQRKLTTAFGLGSPDAPDGDATLERLICRCSDGRELLMVHADHPMRVGARSTRHWLAPEDSKRIFQALDQAE